MSDDLLAKEREYRRLNEDIEQKTREILRNLEQKQETAKKRFEAVAIEKKFVKEERQGDDNEVAGGIVSSFENKNKLGFLNSNGRQATIRLLEAKVQMLTSELQNAREEYKKKENYCEKLGEENKRICDTNEKLHNQIGNLKDTIAKLEKNCDQQKLEMQNLLAENRNIQKEFDNSKKELGVALRQSKSLDTRLRNSLEDREKLKNSLTCSQRENKDLKENIKHLDKERSEYLRAIKKQSLLLDNLKKQQTCWESNRHIELLEKDFSKLLEWDPENLK